MSFHNTFINAPFRSITGLYPTHIVFATNYFHLYLKFLQLAFPWTLFAVLERPTFHVKLTDLSLGKVVGENLVMEVNN